MEGGPVQGSGVSLESPVPPHARERGLGAVRPWDTFARSLHLLFLAPSVRVLEPRSPARIEAELARERGILPLNRGSWYPRRGKGRARLPRTRGGCECKRRRGFILGGEEPQASGTSDFSPFPEFPRISPKQRSSFRAPIKLGVAQEGSAEPPGHRLCPVRCKGGGGAGPAGLPWLRNALAGLGSGISREILPRRSRTDNGL